MLVGYNPSDTDFDTIGKTGGEKTHRLTTSEMPEHRHEGLLWEGSYGITLNAGDTNSYHLKWDGGSTEYIGGTDYQNIKTNYTGGGQAHNNLQPYQVVAYWKRIA